MLEQIFLSFIPMRQNMSILSGHAVKDFHGQHTHVATNKHDCLKGPSDTTAHELAVSFTLKRFSTENIVATHVYINFKYLYILHSSGEYRVVS